MTLISSTPWQRVGMLAGLALGIAMSLAVAPSIQAQETSAESLDTPDADPNALFTPGGGNLRSPFDLYHRANLANSRSPDEFIQEQRSVLSSEIENLRMQQQELLQQGQPTQSPAVTEPANTTDAPTP